MKEHIMTAQMQCPYCDHVVKDSWDYDYDDAGDEVCEACGKMFKFEVEETKAFSTRE